MIKKYFILGWLVGIVCSSQSIALTTEWQIQSYSQVRLLASMADTDKLGMWQLGLEIKLADGWKTYWRMPGAAGLPPTIDWGKSDNVQSMQLQWPTPQRHHLLGFDTFGYQQHVVFPIEWVPQNPAKPSTLVLQVEYMICKDICIPYLEELQLTLPTTGGALFDIEAAGLLEHSQHLLPRPLAATAIKILGTTVQRKSAGDQLVITWIDESPIPIKTLDMIAEIKGTVISGIPQITILGQGRIQLIMPVVDTISGQPAFLPNNGPILLTVLPAGQTAIEILLNVEDLTILDEGGKAPSTPDIWYFLLLALLGGAILNLMPCVLPVLSLKFFGLLQQGLQTRNQTRLSFLMTSAGIIASFILLAAFLAFIKLSGQSLGWGIQFQEPIFLILLATLTTFFAASLWGWVELSLPAVAGKLLGSTQPKMGKHPKNPSLPQAFFTGFLATLLATPCSAPFVTTAIGFALTQDLPTLFLIFMAMAIGLASPYIVIALFPAIIRFLPKPGRWMIYLKIVMGVLLLLTSGWLIWVLSQLLDSSWVFLISLLLVVGLGVLGAKQYGFLKSHRAITRIYLAGILLGLVAVGYGAPYRVKTLPNLEANWQEFEEQNIDALVRQGKTVFVDVTAAWCLTCLANEELVLKDPDIIKAMSQDHVVAMQADWTRPDEKILAYLKKFNRFGIPMNVVYNQRYPQGLVLPVLLHVGMVRDYLR
ncbi:MAG TPA: protein-disulfide reductase DsbD family protein [Alphaproteobacteria bacterium]|nr:protein-disulfide reductase DsbD family protein [Alphaproteobacteria bacterium]